LLGSWLRRSRLTLAFFTCGSFGLFFSSATLYATFKPYAGILERYVQTGDEGEMGDLLGFLGDTQTLPCDDVQFWFAVSALCVFSLFLAVGTFLVQHLRANESI
jgi:hypothetical protein